MKLKSDLDPDFATDVRHSKSRTPTRRLLVLAAIAAVLGLSLASQMQSSPFVVQGARPVATAQRVRLPQPAPDQPGTVAGSQARDHFVAMANPSIDPGMVHRAPSGLDEAMVVRIPDASGTPPLDIVPQPGEPVLPPVPVPPGSVKPNEKHVPRALPHVPDPFEPR